MRPDRAWVLGPRAWLAVFNMLDVSLLSPRQVGSLDRLYASLATLDERASALMALRGTYRTNRAQHIHELFDRTELYFQSYYAALSALNGVVARFGGQFGQVPTESMASFLAWIQQRYPEGEIYDILESARAFRGLLEHPNQYAMYSWNTMGGGGTARYVEAYGAVLNARAPSGSVRVDFADGPGWYFPAPFDGFVTKIFGYLSIRIVLEIAVSTRNLPYPSVFPLVTNIRAFGQRSFDSDEISITAFPTAALRDLDTTSPRRVFSIDGASSLRWHPRQRHLPTKLDRYLDFCLERDEADPAHRSHMTFARFGATGLKLWKY